MWIFIQGHIPEVGRLFFFFLIKGKIVNVKYFRNFGPVTDAQLCLCSLHIAIDSTWTNEQDCDIVKIIFITRVNRPDLTCEPGHHSIKKNDMGLVVPIWSYHQDVLSLKKKKQSVEQWILYAYIWISNGGRRRRSCMWSCAEALCGRIDKKLVAGNCFGKGFLWREEGEYCRVLLFRLKNNCTCFHQPSHLWTSKTKGFFFFFCF